MFFRFGELALVDGFNRPLLISAWTAFDVGTNMS